MIEPKQQAAIRCPERLWRDLIIALPADPGSANPTGYLGAVLTFTQP